MKISRLLLTIILLLISVSVAPAQKKVLIAYHSETGNTLAMANAVREGAESVEDIDVLLKPVDEVLESDLINADAIILGSPVYNANVTPQMSSFIASWPFEGEPLRNKIGAAFVTAGGISAGEEIVQMNLLQSMLIFGMVIVGGPGWTQPFGASGISSEEPFLVQSPGELNPAFLEKGRKLGERVARITLRFNGPIEDY